MNNFCKKCLLKDINKDEYFKSVFEYIERLDDEIRTEETIYQDRLNKCQLCDQLMNGMCSLCGCFVEVRAAKKQNYCADTPRRWNSIK